jgi:hypothetical protein
MPKETNMKRKMPTVQELMPLAQSTTSFKGDWLAALFSFLPLALIALVVLFAIQ